MEQIDIKNVSDYIGEITKLISSDKEITEPYLRYEYLFRGQSNENYDLMPSLGRLGSGQADVYFVERNMISTAQRRLPNIFTNNLQPIELLSLLQHFGIPTRLLDVTENALVALYFACAGSPNKNGEVFIFKNSIFDVSDYPMDYAIAESYKYARPSRWSLEDYFEEIIEQSYFNEQRIMLKKKKRESGALWVEECCKRPIFTSAPLRAERQRMQSGRYIIFPNKIEHNAGTKSGMFVSRIKPMDKDEERIIGRIIVSSIAKDKLLDELGMLGISYGNMFADNADIVCAEIKKQFFIGV